MNDASKSNASTVIPRDTQIDRSEFRRALGRYPTGVVVATTFDPSGQPRGFTANSFASVSLAPPLVLVCLSGTAESFSAFAMGAGFAINVLAAQQREISQRFAKKQCDKFAGVSWRKGPAGNPILERAAAWFDCRFTQRVEAGDHHILLGEVVDFSHCPSAPLAYLGGEYLHLGPEQVLKAYDPEDETSQSSDSHQALLQEKAT